MVGVALALATPAHAHASEPQCAARDAESTIAVTPEVEDPSRPDPATGVLQLRSEPSGALVAVDGLRVGATPLDHVTETGHPRVELFQSGYRLHAADVVVEAESSDPLMVQLEPLPPVASWEPARGRLVVIGAMLGSSVALITSGATLVGIDDRPVRRRCGDFASSDLECPHRYRTEVAGSVLLGVGAAVALSAAVLTMYTNQRNRQQRERHRRPVELRPAWAGVAIAF